MFYHQEESVVFRLFLKQSYPNLNDLLFFLYTVQKNNKDIKGKGISFFSIRTFSVRLRSIINQGLHTLMA